jgi:creatinine amidohydrolase/Fe(II)-dependent formamide hydrolase-like protein
MQWENLTSLDFEKAVQECQAVGILPVGVIEAHSSHLPLGMDMFACHWIACRAAEAEHFPGGVDLLDGDEFGHACEAETSVMLHINADTVKMDHIPSKPYQNARCNADVAGAGGYSSIDWYAMYPHMNVGDARPATVDKGMIMLDCEIENLVKLIRAVKLDDITPVLLQEFISRKEQPKAPKFWTE